MTLLFSFEGRMRRLHWWLIRLGEWGVLIALGIVMMIVSAIVAPGSLEVGGEVPDLIALPFGLLILVYWVGCIWVEIASCVKRFHDQDMSGWFYLIGLIPLIGGLFVLIFCGFIDGTRGPNRFGQSPKAPGAQQSTATVFS